MLWDLVEFHTNMRILWIIICESMIVYLYIKHLYVFNILAVWFVCNLDIVVDGTFEFAICTMLHNTVCGSHCQPHIYLIIIKGHDKHTSWFYIWCGFKFN